MPVGVKVCGLTRAADAAAAARGGARYLGVVFAGGPRRVDIARARDVVSAAGPVPVLGVFGSQPADEILTTSEAAGLAGAQLHGAYPRAVAARLRDAGLTVWRVVRLGAAADLDRLDEAAQDADAVLVEPRVPGVEGGAGVPLALAVATAARARLGAGPMVLAGGLTPETVGAAVAAVRPDLVDVSSGVERSPGVKDHGKITRFLEAVFGYSPTA